MYQLIDKATGQVICEAMAYATLEAEYQGETRYYIRNARTGVEWEIP